MKEHSSKIKNEEKKEYPNSSGVALGFFDGIHLGHKAVINAMLSAVEEENEKDSLAKIVYTFQKNPAYLFGKSVEIITTNEERYNIIKDMGVDRVVEDDFTSVMNFSPREFVEKVLVQRFNAKKVFCGFNYHFGKGGTADSGELTRLCSLYGIEVTVVPPVVMEEITVSSTEIRNFVRNGEIEKANILLDRKFGFSAVIEEGNHIGRLMNTPTINQKLPKGLVIPRFGVYTSLVTIGDKCYTGVTNIGVKPTIGDYLPLSETWLPDYKEKDLYGEVADIRLMYFQRDERKFDNIKALEEQIKKDGEKAKINIAKGRRS